MTQKLNWTTNDVANTDTHNYRIETIGNSHRVIYSHIDGKYLMQSSTMDSVQAAKQWAQNYHNKYGRVMSDKKQEANVIFAIHFDDVNDPRYKEITALLMHMDMWRNNNLVYCEALDSRDALVNYKRDDQ